MKTLFSIFFILDWILFFLAAGFHPFSGDYGLGSAHIYFWLLFVSISLTAFIFCLPIVSFISRESAFLCVLLFNFLLGVIGLIFFVWVLRSWPGGDDGNGLGWCFLVIPASILAALFSLVATLTYFGKKSNGNNAKFR